MVTDRIHKTLKEKSKEHQENLERLGTVAPAESLASVNLAALTQTRQVQGINTLLFHPSTTVEDFIFYFDRLVALLVETAVTCMPFDPTTVYTPLNHAFYGLKPRGEISAVVILRGGSTMETGLKRIIPDCRTGRILIQTSHLTGEPELHFFKLSADIHDHQTIMLLDPQMASGGAALMAVRVLVDHGVKQCRIVFVTYLAGRLGLKRLMSVYPEIRVIVGTIVDDEEPRWIEARYLGC